MAMQRGGQGARRHRVLNEEELLACLGAVDHEPHADAPREPALPSRGPTTFAAIDVASFLDCVA